MSVIDDLHEIKERYKINISGIDKFKIIQRHFKEKTTDKIKDVLDIGGNYFTYAFLRETFPKCKVTTYNNDKREARGIHNVVIGDIEKVKIKGKFDIAYLGDVIEHLAHPDEVLKKVHNALRKNGWIIITTPNLANIFNRLSLLCGWSLVNYSAAKNHKFGNPFLKFGENEFEGQHLSVFTYNELKQCIKRIGFKIVHTNGYSYYDFQRIYTAGGKKDYTPPYPLLRKMLNRILPDTLKEGVVVISKKIGR